MSGSTRPGHRIDETTGPARRLHHVLCDGLPTTDERMTGPAQPSPTRPYRAPTNNRHDSIAVVGGSEEAGEEEEDEEQERSGEEAEAGMGRGVGMGNPVNVGIAVQADWENREFISNISLNVRRLFDFLLRFEATTKSKLASLNEKLDILERKLEVLEVQVSSATTNPSVFN